MRSDPVPASCCLRESVVSGSPSLYHAMLGSGFPVVEQDKVTVDDRAAVVLLGWDRNCGDVGAVCVYVCVEQYHKFML